MPVDTAIPFSITYELAAFTDWAFKLRQLALTDFHPEAPGLNGDPAQYGGDVMFILERVSQLRPNPKSHTDRSALGDHALNVAAKKFKPLEWKPEKPSRLREAWATREEKEWEAYAASIPPENFDLSELRITSIGRPIEQGSYFYDHNNRTLVLSVAPLLDGHLGAAGSDRLLIEQVPRLMVPLYDMRSRLQQLKSRPTGHFYIDAIVEMLEDAHRVGLRENHFRIGKRVATEYGKKWPRKDAKTCEAFGEWLTTSLVRNARTSSTQRAFDSGILDVRSKLVSATEKNFKSPASWCQNQTPHNPTFHPSL